MKMSLADWWKSDRDRPFAYPVTLTPTWWVFQRDDGRVMANNSSFNNTVREVSSPDEVVSMYLGEDAEPPELVIGMVDMRGRKRTKKAPEEES